ncbi:carbohydrate ABC transporter permease [Paenibacillus sp. GCM10023250]|uniref:carbohydrate ABC transporter permease n=1 Tax=Paenibacillus sp. GCM10023250 TaxID=3252648 RepID=UPI00360F6A28
MNEGTLKSKLPVTAAMLIAGVFMIVPFLWMISTSFQTPTEVFKTWLPAKLDWSSHKRIWTGNYNFLPYYLNSVKIAVIATAGAVFLSALAAYGFARTAFRGRDAMFLLYLSMMMIPPQVIFVPKFIMFNWMHIYNTHWALILPGMFSIFGVFMLRQFFMGIPREITESAFLDGAGHFTIFLRLMLPLAKPALATFAIIDFSWQWNDYENALVFLQSPKLYTIPLGLQNFILENNVDYNGMMAASSAAIIPMIVIFLVGQKYIIQGVASSAVKG